MKEYVDHEGTWVSVCRFDRLERDRGACALVGGDQVALFRVGSDDALYAVSNYDPFSRAFVISRGIVGSRGDVVKVASPIYKQCFDLATGICLEDPNVRLARYDVRVRDGMVEVRLPEGARLRRAVERGARPAPAPEAVDRAARDHAEASCAAPGGAAHERTGADPTSGPGRARTGGRVRLGALASLRVVILESRERARMTEMLEAKGARVCSFPVLAFRDAFDRGPIEGWVRALAAREFDIVIFLTGEGVKRLLEQGRRLGIEAAFVAGLARTRTLTRGPKPARALREVGVLPTLTAEIPTTDGVIEALRSKDLRGSTIAVQLCPKGGPGNGGGRLLSYLRSAGAEVRPVWPYLYENGLSEPQIRELVDLLATGQADVLAFTSRAQVERLFDMAMTLDLRGRLDLGLNQTRIAALGPVVAAALRNRGHRVAIVPTRSFFMKSLVQEIAALASRISTTAA